MTSSKSGVSNVCLCFTDGSGVYYKHSLVVLASVFENTRTPVRVHLVIDDTLSESGKEAFTALAKRYGHETIFHPVPPLPRAVVESVRGGYGIGTVFRLFIPELVQEEQVLYMDCDVVCTLDVAEILALDIGELPAAAVRDAGQLTSRHLARLRGIGLDSTRYCNAGVVRLNLARIRADFPDYTQTMLDSLAGKKLSYVDQDALNLYFQARDCNICVLPDAYNYIISVADRAYLDPPAYAGKILHYTRDKPWAAIYPAALLYWKYYAIAFSGTEAFNAMERLGRHEYAHLHAFLLRTPRMRRMVNRAWQISEHGIIKTLLDRLVPSRKKQKRHTCKHA